MRGPVPEALPERLYSLLVLAVIIALVVFFDVPRLLWPGFVLALVLISIDRWRRGVYPWPPRQRPR